MLRTVFNPLHYEPLIASHVSGQLYYPTAGYKITYSVATLSYDNCYANLWDYSNSLLCDLL
jgi:hypothetical protein